MIFDRKNIITVAFLFFSLCLSAQKHDYNWVICNGISQLNFTEEFVSIIETNDTFPMIFNCASISDENGNLLFYTNGCSIEGANYETIDNGDNINPGDRAELFCDFGYHATQGSLFLPVPGNENLYYLIHLGLEDFSPHGAVGFLLQYSLLDKSTGFGRALEKNQLLLQDTLAYGMVVATKHANGRDWWVVVPEMASNKFYRFLIDPEGIHGPWEQRLGTVNQDDDGTGQAKFSPNGAHYARMDGYNKLHVFDFDRCSGLLSKHEFVDFPELPTNHIPWSGLSFSPNSEVLYVIRPSYIYQLDMKTMPLIDSRIIVGEFDGYEDPLPGYFFQGQLGPDNRIYISSSNGNAFLNTIESPNVLGADCFLIQHSILLPSRNYSTLPNNPNFRLGRLAGSACDTLPYPEPICAVDNVLVTPNPFWEEIFIQISDCPPGDFTFTLFDVLGRVVFIQDFAGYESVEVMQILNLAPEIYFYQLSKSGAVISSGKLLHFN